MKEILKKDVKDIIRNQTVLCALKDIGVQKVSDLCAYSRMELTEKGFENSSLKEIRIALQLNGMDLKPNHAKRNSLTIR